MPYITTVNGDSDDGNVDSDDDRCYLPTATTMDDGQRGRRSPTTMTVDDERQRLPTIDGDDELDDDADNR